LKEFPAQYTNRTSISFGFEKLFLWNNNLNFIHIILEVEILGRTYKKTAAITT